MTANAKLGIASCTASAMMLLAVFSKPLHIPEAGQWILLLGAWIPLYLTFRLNKRLKLEKSHGFKPAQAPTDAQWELKKKTRRNLLLSMLLGCVIALCSPLWMPLTGTTLGAKKDFLIGVLTAVIVCAIIGSRLRKV